MDLVSLVNIEQPSQFSGGIGVSFADLLSHFVINASIIPSFVRYQHQHFDNDYYEARKKPISLKCKYSYYCNNTDHDKYKLLSTNTINFLDYVQDFDFDKENNTCPICYDLVYPPVILNCNHSFCKKCLDSYDKKKEYNSKQMECPLCRKEYNYKFVCISYTTKIT